YPSFEEELDELRRLDEETAGLGFLRPLWDHGGRRKAALLEDARVQEHVRSRAADMGADEKLASLMFGSPQKLLRGFASLLADYCLSGAVLRRRRAVEAPVRGGRARPAGPRRRDPPSCLEADRGRASLDAGARAARGHQRGWAVKAPTAARPGRPRRKPA